MSRITNKVVNKSKDVLLGDVSSLLVKLEESIRHIDDKLGTVQHAIEETELRINHNQLELINELNQRVKNSGTLVLSETEMVTKIFSGLKIYLDPRDLAISVPLALDSVWEHRITEAWLAVVKPNDTVFDVGANNAYYGALAAQKSDKKNSRVVLFEANPHLIPYIRKTLNINWLNEQTTIENLAVADQDGTQTLHILNDYVGSSSVHPNDRVDSYMHNKMKLETKEAIKIQSVSIDSYCQSHGISSIDLMIMDIEGFEEKAYSGMRKTVKASPNMTLFIEFTKDGYEDPKTFYNTMLEDFGHVYLIDDKGYIFKPKSTAFEAVIGEVDDWVMPIFSKNGKLANR